MTTRLAIEGTSDVRICLTSLRDAGFDVGYNHQSTSLELATPRILVDRFVGSKSDVGVILNARGYTRFLQNYLAREQRFPIVVLSEAVKKAKKRVGRYTPYIYQKPTSRTQWDALAEVLETIVEMERSYGPQRK